MKIWKSHSAEHSARMRVVGNFKTVDNAQSAVEMFNAIIDRFEETKNQSFPSFYDRFKPIYEQYGFQGLSKENLEELLYLYPLEKPNDTQITYESDDDFVQILTRVIMFYGGRLEIYSRHDYSV